MQALDLMGGRPRDIPLPLAVNAAWSPDGRRIVYHHGTGGDHIFTMDADFSNKAEVDVPTEEGYHQHYPMWSLDGEWIFTARGWVTTGAVDLWRVRPNGKDLEQLTHDKRYVGYPTPVDDRTLLYVAQDADGAGPWLWFLDLETKASRRAALGMEHYTSVSASADGKRVVATIENSQASLWTVPIREEGESTESDVEPYRLSASRALLPRVRGDDLYYLSSYGSADGLWQQRNGELTEILRGTEAALLEPPALSPDGKSVVVTLRENTGGRLWLIDLASGSRTRLGGPLIPRGAADWSPDGKWVVVGGSVSNQNGLYKIDVETGRPAPVLAGEAINPVWSPDGSMIVYAGRQLNTWTPLIAVRPENGDAVEGWPEINAIANGERARFMPDGSALVYMDGLNPGQDFFRLDLGTMKTRRLTRLDTAIRMRTFDITKDGRTIVFDRIRQDSDIVLFER
jgi:Tol biopolymer transport system component